MKKHLMFICVVSYLLSSCCKKTDCVEIHEFTVEFRGFTLDEIDTIYTTGFALNSSFTEVTKEEQKDTVREYENNYLLVHDIGYRPPIVLVSSSLNDNHEWKLYIPSINRTVLIYNYGYNTYKCGGCTLKKGDRVASLSTCSVDDSTKRVDNIVVYR